MQEDILKLILRVLSRGELIARKSLVIYIVQTLQDKYPHVSKTCVGHVVQLAYRASCFNVYFYLSSNFDTKYIKIFRLLNVTGNHL